ncbi:prepilin-type N-terminal cleavage/methylation domain-containing protein [Colwellia sp. MB02u-9]|uniref:prepilin-type N-terminal cleavage/methylation domain-containing protein n=1 Tax=Colwellia sp. MB02u-9 TaxID=2759823 RepID=UPI0015F74815|nr:prepilin-type N-terminal cleavage/methylation domain-containing protein [Colwellia sp. MB02u-9]MBA6297632.1 prepilin-type N-terminal cleavage/methylation domain-containing protein [Colwellia sp. MB02u-9]
MKQLTNNSFSKQKGFTLIELVVVIVILGILAATAAPKFIDLTGDARTSVMKGVQGSINSAVNLAHAKALVAGQTSGTGEIEIGTKFYALVNGFPAKTALGTGATTEGLGIDSLVELEAGTEITFAAGVFTHTGAPTPADCILTYTDAENSETPPVLTTTISGC